MHKYGEPWKPEDLCPDEGTYMQLEPWLAQRFVSCVNALAGVEDPAAVRELVKALNSCVLASLDAISALAWLPEQHRQRTGEAVQKLREANEQAYKALAPFEGME